MKKRNSHIIMILGAAFALLLVSCSDGDGGDMGSMPIDNSYSEALGDHALLLPFAGTYEGYWTWAGQQTGDGAKAEFSVTSRNYLAFEDFPYEAIANSLLGQIREGLTTDGTALTSDLPLGVAFNEDEQLLIQTAMKYESRSMLTRMLSTPYRLLGYSESSLYLSGEEKHVIAFVCHATDNKSYAITLPTNLTESNLVLERNNYLMDTSLQIAKADIWTEEGLLRSIESTAKQPMQLIYHGKKIK